MPTNTYVALDTKTLGTAVPTVTFTSIPQGYTDLVLVASPAITSGNDNMRIRVGNGSVDSGSNYSWTALTGNGTRALSDRASNQTSILSDYDAYMQTTLGNSTKVIHFQNYSNTTTFKTILSRSSNAPVGTDTLVNTWRSTSAINTITLFLNGGIQNFSVGSTFTIYGIANADNFAKATGGMLYEDSTYWYHVFAANGTFTPKQALTCDYLVVAGGGGGAGGGGPAGGGAGGLRSTVTATGGGGTLETALSVTSGTAYAITVGAGGASGTGNYPSATKGTNGGNSVFSTVTSTGGGGGGPSDDNTGDASGVTGGSGGGSASTGGTGGGTPGNGTTNQGYSGGFGYYDGGSARHAGGGGGAGGIGGGTTASPTGNGGNGGAGVTISALATPTGTGVSGAYAGGGAGRGDTTNGTATAGGGAVATSGAAYTGGGGGGGTGANGGSGIVIVRYLKA
jgi:hypothetical protein